MSTTKAVSYLRVSGKGQVKGHGFERQRQACRQYARANGLRIVAEFRDEGVSGTKELQNRPGLAALLDRVESNGVGAVLVERSDRLARDLLVGEVILGQLRDLGVRVVEADGGNDLTAGDGDPTRKLIRQVLGAVSEFEKSVVVLKLRAARDRVRAVKGKCEGKKPFGFHPGERPVLARMVHLYRQRKRLGTVRIAAQLNAEGVKTRTGKPWSQRTVYGILKREGVVRRRG